MSSRATSVRPPYITIRISRTRSASVVQLPSISYTPPLSSPTSFPPVHSVTDPVQTNYSTMPRKVVTYLLSFFTTKPEQHMYSLSPSESSSSDSLSLPLPASPQQSSFATEVWQEDGHFRVGGRPTATETVPWWSGGVSAFVPMLFIIVLFPLSTMLVFAGLFTLPITASFPRTLSELAQLCVELQIYSESGLRPQAHVLGILSLTALWKHAWSVPGSALLNVLAGVLLSPISATLFMTALTAIGSVLSTLLAMPLAPVISHVFPKAVALTRSTLEGGDALTSSRDKSSVWVRLSVLRLIGVVPWSGINIACGVAGVALFDCLLGSFIGTLPWTAVTCQVGDLVQTVASTSGSGSSQTITSVLHSPNVVLKLAILTLVSLVPILARDRLKSLIGRAPEHAEVASVAIKSVDDKNDGSTCGKLERQGP